MSCYNNAPNQYGTYYDPVGSSTNQQPTGYTHSAPAAATAYTSSNPSNYSTATYPTYGSGNGNATATTSTGYSGNQQQSRTAGSSSVNNASHAAAALSSLGSDYAQQSNNTAQYDNSSWGNASYNSGIYTNNNSPAYAPQASTKAYSKSSVPTSYPSHGQSEQTTRATPSAQSYSTTYAQPTQTQQTQQQPQRYNSPMQAQQAQPSSRPTPSYRPFTHSPAQSAAQPANRQQSGSVEPSPATVNPSQVYDDRAEKQRKAHIEAEKRRKREAEAAREAEEDKVAAEAEAARKAEEEERQQKELAAQAAAKKAEYERKAEEKRKAREEKRQSKTAATALTKMASSGENVQPAGGQNVASSSGGTATTVTINVEGDGLPPPANAEEAEMRAMFKKMREFNARNPAMLAKLWEEERKTHSAQASTQPPPQSPPQPVARPAPKAPAQKKAAPAKVAAPSTAPQAPPSSAAAPSKSAKPAAPKSATQRPAVSSNPPLWPQQKKGALAESAAKWMSTLPENAGKNISKEGILKILESNPSYIQLCEALEGLGLRFQRASLARELLKVTPESHHSRQPMLPPPESRRRIPLAEQNRLLAELNGSGPKMNDKAATARSMFTNKTVNYETPSFPSLQETAREVNNMGRSPSLNGGPVQPPIPTPTPPHGLPSHFSPFVGVNSRPVSQPTVQTPAPEPKPEPLRKPPANKEEAARKRTFGDLVDLTAEDSDDDAPPPKLLQPPTGPINGAMTQPAPAPAAFRAPPTFNATEYTYQITAPSNLPQHPFRTVPTPIHTKGFMSPSQVPKPASPKPPPKPKGPTAESLQQERMRGRMLVEPIMRDRVARKSKYDTRTIARDVLLATGRHPDMRALNAHMNRMQKLLGDHGGSYETDGTKGNRSDLSTIRWDIIDPDVPKSAEAASLPVAIAPKKPIEEVDDADDEDEDPIGTVAPAAAPARAVRQATVQHGDGTVSYVSVYEQTNHKPAGPRKHRGRPRKHPVTDTAPFSTDQGQRQKPPVPPKNAAISTRPASQTPARGAPASSPMSAPPPTAQAVGYSAFQQIDETGKKKKGRPFGWRKSLHSREANGLTPAKSGAPAKAPIRLREMQEPEYQVYKCQWEACAAELHNLDTLKKHVLKIHGRPAEDGEFECHWVPCGGEVKPGSSKGKGRVTDLASFSDIESWIGHIDKQHLQPVAWKLGDGPRGGMSDNHNTDSEALYLSDAQGRSVTPIIQPTTTDAAASGIARPRVGRPPQDDSRRAAAALDSLTAHKRAVGAVMVKTGSTLASPKRRLGFLDDEDFEDEVMSEGE